MKSAFQPQFEADDALRLARELGASVTVLRADVLADARVAANPSDRCYFCKKIILSAIRAQAEKDGYDVLLDGTNASDDIADRPGWKALQEEGVLSPLRLCGLKKADVRRLSKEAGLFTASKPAYACLATRIPCGEAITQGKARQSRGGRERAVCAGLSRLSRADAARRGARAGHGRSDGGGA